MRILHVAPSVARSYGGPAHSLDGYVRAARAHGADVDVYSPYCAPGDLATARGAEWAPRLFPAFGRGAFIASPTLWATLARTGGRYDVIHVHGLFNPVSSLAARIAIARRWPLVIRPFGTLSAFTFEHRRRALKRVFFTLFDGPNLRRAEAVHFTTEGERRNSDWHGIEFGGRAHVVPPPYTRDVPAPAPAAHPDAPVVLCLARLHRVKAIETLIAAWPAVHAALPTARLIIAGDGDAQYGRGLRLQAGALKIETSIEFTGFVGSEAKRALLARATVVALPSYHENFGLAVLEALGAGLPVVVSPEVQLAEFITRHNLGIVSGRESDELAAALVRTLRNRELQVRCRSVAPALVADTFSERAIGARLLHMYESAISRS